MSSCLMEIVKRDVHVPTKAKQKDFFFVKDAKQKVKRDIFM